MTIKGLKRLLAAALSAACIGGCACAEEIPQLLEPAGVQLAAAEAVTGDISKITVYSGAVVPHVEELCFAVDGEIEDVCVVYGQKVRAGDVLITLNQEAQTERIEALEEQIDALRAADGYAKQLAQIDREILQLELEAILAGPDGDGSEAALKRLDIEEHDLKTGAEAEIRQADLRRLEAEYEKLTAELGSSELIAPFDGQVMYMKTLVPGGRVSAYAPLIYLADESRLSLETEYVSETVITSAVDMYAMVGDQKCAVEYAPMDTEEYLAMVLSGEELKSRFELTDGFEGMTAGEYAAVCVETGRVEDALIVPRNAVYMEAGVRYVYVVEDGVRIRREVQTGVTNDWDAQILAGLEEGEHVYVQD